MSEWLGVFAIGVGFLVIGHVVGGAIMRHDIQKVAATYECAQYNQTTGDFEWLDTK